METELISVIVPVYNVERYLRRCVDSILHQTYRNLEVLLVDDGSTDASGAICDEYAAQEERVTAVHQKNGGLSAARNAGLERAQGTYREPTCVTVREPLAGVPYDQTSFGLPSCAFAITSTSLSAG